MLKTYKDSLPEMWEKKPWISEDEQKDLTDKIADVDTWFNEKVAKQESMTLEDEPVYN